MDYIQAVRVFQCVIDEGSFASASRKMDLSPAMVTRQVKFLEGSLGVRLLNRSTRGMVITNAGEEYLARLRPILSDLDDAADQVRSHSSEIAGVLRVSTTSLVSVNLLVPCLMDFQRAYPEIRVEISTNDRPGHVVKKQDLSILRFDNQLSPDVVVRPLLDMHYVLCASDEYLKYNGEPKSPEDLSEHRVICLRPSDSKVQSFLHLKNVETAQEVEIPYSWSVISNDDETVHQATMAGAGIAFIPEMILLGRPHLKRLRRVVAPWVGVDDLRLVATLPSRNFIPQRTRTFLDFFVDYVKRKSM